MDHATPLDIPPFDAAYDNGRRTGYARDSAAPSSDPVGALLRAVFDGREAAARFVVLRNGDRLPHALAGNDLDVSTLPGWSLQDVAGLIIERALEQGWVSVCISR